jgi:predicted CxxxxCH...CXXCH cytochrome family protein
MRRGLRTLLTLTAVTATAMVRVSAPQTPQQSAPAGATTLVSDGKKVFQATCSSQYCHGPGGTGGQGPRLINRSMAPEYVTATVRDGRSGTNMAPFKNILETAEINAVIAYVLSLSPVAATPATSVNRSEPSSVPVSVGQGRGSAAGGAEVFFDATRLSSCRTCHTYDKRGGPLGVDFADAHETPEEVLTSITRPQLVSRDYPAVAVTTDGGEKLTGIRGGETADTLQVFDVAIPPVRRSFRKSQIAVVAVSGKGLFDHTKLGLTRQQQLDVAALLGTSER